MMSSFHDVVLSIFYLHRRRERREVMLICLSLPQAFSVGSRISRVGGSLCGRSLVGLAFENRNA